MKLLLKILLTSTLALGLARPVIGAELKEHSLLGIPKSIEGNKVYNDNILTLDQLKSCLQTSRKLDLLNNILDSQSGGFDNRVKALNDLATQIEQSQAYLDSHPTKEVNDNEGIAARNAKVQAHNEMVDTYNRETAAYEKETRSYQENTARYSEMRNSFSEDCATKQYYLEDMDEALIEN
jgi:hypothetical protein